MTIVATFQVGTTLTDPTTVTFKVRAPDGIVTPYVYLTAMNVTRLSEGVYQLDYGIPADPGQYHYKAVGTGACEDTLPGEFFVIPSSVDVPDEPPGPVLGPGLTWINGEDLANCAGFDPTAEPQLADAAAIEASMTLWMLSGRQFSGRVGPVTVRPPADQACGHWNGDFTYGGYTWVWLDAMGSWAWSADNGDVLTGCGYLSRVKLSGYPVREIVEVKIDGDVLPTTYTPSGAPTYRLDKWRFLTRLDDPDQPSLNKQWPGCQNLALEDDQPGTFSVTYTYGVDPPVAGINAARQLACQILLALDGQDCQLPTGVTKIVGSGVTMDRGILLAWGRDAKTGIWNTGLTLVDLFLNSYNPQRLQRRPAVIGDATRYAPILGEQNL